MLMGFLLALLLAGWVYYDARRRGEPQPGLWALGTVVMAIVVLPMWLVRRPPLTTAATTRPCPYCAESIKPDATVCRFCQRDVPSVQTAESDVILTAQTSEPSPFRYLWIPVVAFALYLALASYRSPDGSATSSVTIPSMSAPYAGSFDATELFRAYEENEVAADQRFKGKRVALRGRILKIGKDFVDQPYLMLAVDGHSLAFVQGLFERESDLLSLSPGQDVDHVQCVVDGKVLMQVIARRCSR